MCTSERITQRSTMGKTIGIQKRIPTNCFRNMTKLHAKSDEIANRPVKKSSESIAFGDIG